jgi:hypothetical protein
MTRLKIRPMYMGEEGTASCQDQGLSSTTESKAHMGHHARVLFNESEKAAIMEHKVSDAQATTILRATNVIPGDKNHDRNRSQTRTRLWCVDQWH